MTSSTSAGREPSPELLPCPWCGEVPKLWSAPSNVIDHGAAHVEHPDTDCLMRKVVVRAVDWNRRPPVVRGPDPHAADCETVKFAGVSQQVFHCPSGDFLTLYPRCTCAARNTVSGPGQELREAEQQKYDAICEEAHLAGDVAYRDHDGATGELGRNQAANFAEKSALLAALRLALSGTTKEVSAEEEEPATCWCPSGVAHDPDCPDYKKRQAGVSESSTSLGASGRNRPVGHGPSGTPAVGDNGVPVAPGSSAEASAASPAPAVSGEPRTTRKEGIPHELAAEIRRAAANLANDYEMGERPCCADLARRIARGIRKLDLEAFAKASGEPRRGIPLTRVEVIDHRADSETFGRAFVAWDVAMELSYQDHGRTLKVFVDDKGALPNNPGEQAASASGANASNAESAQDGASPAGIPREPSEQAVRAAALALNNFNSDKYPWVEGSNWSVVWRDLTAALKAAYAVDSVAPAPTSEGPHESGTYGELPFSIRHMVAGHEWDNMDREQQRAWLIQRLAVSEGPLPHSPPSLLESQMYKERLLPCPFCGAAAVRRMVSVGCGNEFCRVRPNVIAKDAAEFWNVRGLPSVSDPEKR